MAILLAYNKTTADVTLAAGNPIVTLPASSSWGARGSAVAVTSELEGLSSANYALLQAQADIRTTVSDNPLTSGAITVNVASTTGLPIAGQVQIENELISFTGKTATSLTGCTRGANGTVAATHSQGVQVFAYQVDYEWTDSPSYLTPGLEVGVIQKDFAQEGVAIYVNSSTGSDSNNGTLTSPVATLAEATSRLPNGGWRKSCRVIFDTDGIPRTYTFPGNSSGESSRYGSARYLGTPLIFIGTKTTLQAQQTNTISGINNTVGGSFSNTAITDNPLSSGATTINVSSTTGFPTTGIIQIVDGTTGIIELVRYTGVTATSFTGCTRAYAGTTAASHVLGSVVIIHLFGYWLRVTGGTNNGQRLMVKWNSATTLSVMRNAPSNFDLTSTYVVEAAGTQINTNNWRPFYTEIAFKDVILNLTVGFMFSQGTHLMGQGVDHRLNSISGFWASNPGLWRTSSLNAIFAGDGAGNPFPVAEDFAGMRVEGPGTFALRVGFANIGVYGFVNLTAQIDSISVVFNSIIAAQGGVITIGRESSVVMQGQAVNNKVFFSNCPITIDDNSFLFLINCDLINSPSSGLLVRRAGQVQFSNVGGNQNTRYGLEVLEGGVQLLDNTVSSTLTDNPLSSSATTINVASAADFSTNGEIHIENEIILYTAKTATSFTGCVRGYFNTVAASHVVGTTVQQGTCVTGVRGDMKCGSRKARTWLDFASASPASGSAPKNELDTSGSVMRPFKRTFTGLSAAASFDLTTIDATGETVNSTTLTGNITSTATSIAVTSAVGFPGFGIVLIDNEQISYTGITVSTNTLTGCLRGVNGTSAAAHLAAATVTENSNRSAAQDFGSLRVTAVGTAALGVRTISDSGDTPTATIATLSDDGKTLTFEGTVTGFIVNYTPVINQFVGASRIWQSA